MSHSVLLTLMEICFLSVNRTGSWILIPQYWTRTLQISILNFLPLLCLGITMKLKTTISRIHASRCWTRQKGQSGLQPSTWQSWACSCGQKHTHSKPGKLLGCPCCPRTNCGCLEPHPGIFSPGCLQTQEAEFKICLNYDAVFFFCFHRNASRYITWLLTSAGA